MSIRVSLSSRNRSDSPYARMVGNPDKLSEKWEYSEDLNTASNEKHQYSLGFLDAETNWSLTKTLRRKRRSLGQVYINSPNHKRYLKFSSTGTIERSCVCINQENDEHANQEPGKDNGNQNHCSKDGGESGHKYPEGIWSVESHYYTTKKLGRSNRLTPQYIVDRIDIFFFLHGSDAKIMTMKQKNIGPPLENRFIIRPSG